MVDCNLDPISTSPPSTIMKYYIFNKQNYIITIPCSQIGINFMNVNQPSNLRNS